MTSLDATLKAAALSYDGKGWRVIPLHRVGPDGKTCSCKQGANCGRSAGKHPKDEAWQNSPRLSQDEIAAIWGQDRSPNLGVATGTPSGFWVLDIDPEGGGFDTMRDIVTARGALPETFVTQTGSGGYHYFFAMPAGKQVRNTQGRIGPGIDTRGTGGQIVIAPSRSGKGDYVIVSDLPVAEAPAWLLELVIKDDVDLPIITAEELPKPEEIDPADWERFNAYAQRVIDAELARLDELKAKGWDGPPWNATTFEASCALLEIANSPWNSYSTGQAQADVMARAPRDAEFDNCTVQKTFDSARQKVGEQARPVPADRSSEPDPLFANPQVRQRPTGGGEEPSGLPVVPREVTEYDFFDGKDYLAATAAQGVLARGPVGWGRDKDFWEYVGGAWSPKSELVEDRLTMLLGDKYRPAHYASSKPIVRRLAQPISGDPDPDHINFLNGMLDWRTGTLLDHDPSYGSTVQMQVDWTPDAVCPVFDSFLAEVMHEDYVELAWEMIGYLMYSGNPMQVAFMLYGHGGNGKGTLLRVIQNLLGHGNVANESLDQLNNSTFSSVNLYGKIANIAGDIDSTYQETTATFKGLVGEDMIGAERKFGARFQFENWAVPVFSANKFPGSSDVTEGYLRRWVVLHFHKKIQNAIPGFSDILVRELPGIAAKAIPALQALMARSKFEPVGEATKGIKEFAEAIDQVRQWVASGTPLQAPEAYGSLSDLYSSYAIWAERSGRRKVTEVEFSHRLDAAGYEHAVQQGVEYHKGLTAPALSLHRTPATMFDD